MYPSTGCCHTPMPNATPRFSGSNNQEHTVNCSVMYYVCRSQSLLNDMSLKDNQGF